MNKKKTVDFFKIQIKEIRRDFFLIGKDKTHYMNKKNYKIGLYKILKKEKNNKKKYIHFCTYIYCTLSYTKKFLKKKRLQIRSLKRIKKIIRNKRISEG